MDSYKILAQVTPSINTDTILYSVPEVSTTSAGSVVVTDKASAAITQTLVTSVVITRLSFFGGAALVNLYLFPTTTISPVANTNYLMKQNSIPVVQSKILPLGLTLGPGNTLACRANKGITEGSSRPTDGVSFTVIGVETTA